MNESGCKLSNAVSALKKKGEDQPVPEHIVAQTKKRFAFDSIKPPNVLRHVRFLRFAAVAVVFFIAIISIPIVPFISPQVAWADVQDRFVNIKSFQFYEFDYRGSIARRAKKGWYKEGVVYYQNKNGSFVIDNGIDRIKYDSDGTAMSMDRSEWGDLSRAKHETVFNIIMRYILLYKEEAIENCVPSDIGKDFLLYTFEAGCGISEDIEKVSILVGKRSQLPVQMKVYYKDDAEHIDFVIFEYCDTGLPDELKDIISCSGKTDSL